MTLRLDVPGAGVADVTEAGLLAGGETGLGNLAVIQNMEAGPARGGSPAGPALGAPQVPAAAASLFAGHAENLAAVFRSGQLLAGGVQEMRRDWAAASAGSLKLAQDAVAAFAAARSVPDLVAAQSNLVRSTVDRAFTQGAQVAASSMRLTHQAFEPIHARMASAAKAFIHAR